MKDSLAARKMTGTPISLDLTGTTVTSGAYVQLQAALANPATAVLVSNTSAKTIKLATGGAGAEVDLPIYVTPGAQGVLFPVDLKKGVRLAARALGADATTGYLVVNFLA